ncbi:hypothetical protein [Streptomyces coeruleorubidus]|uniref:Uncharacterized protein n=1 Tax=Streptomyces coeruleorubidus TaxID=116188 RepID=A0A5J6HVR4_STRC4|nr:hypothetical protein [Streptomyces coeruleorubidus]QEV23928.1 hypothetical protein CP976_07070 [Streptomyces coeruleorubidus]GGT86062.1 hypothetical protein GCM10010256_52790 [Streptomyces coeruleorubidus]
MSDIEFPDDLIALERAAWEELQAGRLTVATAVAVQDAITAHAEAAGMDRYTVEMALKRAVRHTPAES